MYQLKLGTLGFCLFACMPIYLLLIRMELVLFCWWWEAEQNQFCPDPACRLSAFLYDLYDCCVYSQKLMMDRGTILKHVEFYSKNKFERLVHLVGFVIRIPIIHNRAPDASDWSGIIEYEHFSYMLRTEPRILQPKDTLFLAARSNSLQSGHNPNCIVNSAQRLQKAATEQKEFIPNLFYAFFLVIPRRLKFICRRFGTLCLFHLHRQVGMKNDWG